LCRNAACFEDEIHDCHIATSEDTLQTIAMYSAEVCKSNPESFGLNIVIPLLPRLYATPPSPCKESGGYWSCHTVLAEDTLWASIARWTKIDPQFLMEANFGKDPTRCKDCRS
jgi:hypothetical protein